MQNSFSAPLAWGHAASVALQRCVTIVKSLTLQLYETAQPSLGHIDYTWPARSDCLSYLQASCSVFVEAHFLEAPNARYLWCHLASRLLTSRCQLTIHPICQFWTVAYGTRCLVWSLADNAGKRATELIVHWSRSPTFLQPR